MRKNAEIIHLANFLGAFTRSLRALPALTCANQLFSSYVAKLHWGRKVLSRADNNKPTETHFSLLAKTFAWILTEQNESFLPAEVNLANTENQQTSSSKNFSFSVPFQLWCPGKEPTGSCALARRGRAEIKGLFLLRHHPASIEDQKCEDRRCWPV